MAVRDAKGRFVKGHSGNPGGKPADTIAKLIRQAINERMTQEKVNEIAQALIDQAANGDAKARKHLFALYGIDIEKITLTHDGAVQVTVVYKRE